MATQTTIPDHVGIVDIETLPGDAVVGMDLTQAPGWVPTPIDLPPIERRTVPSSWKDEAKKAAWEVKEKARFDAEAEKQTGKIATLEADQKAKALKDWRAHSLDPMKGRIGLITLAMGEHSVHVIDCAEDERAGLVELGEFIMDHQAGMNGRRIQWVAHNGFGFDFPYVQLRALAHGSTKLASRFHQEKQWDNHLVDTLKWWPQMGGWGKPKGNLDAICAHLGIERLDNPIGGAKVLDAYVEGRWPDVVKHGVADVRDLREVFRVLLEVRGG